MSLFGRILNSKPVREKIQEKLEDTAYRVNPGLGDAVNRGNEVYNKALDTQKRVVQTVRNGVDSTGLPAYLRCYLGSDAENLRVGDQLFVQRVNYTHHGLYYGNGEVIHYLQEGVTIDSLETFADGSVIRKKTNLQSPTNYPSTEIIDRAISRLGESSYNVVTNNCEHFCRWCRSGE